MIARLRRLRAVKDDTTPTHAAARSSAEAVTLRARQALVAASDVDDPDRPKVRAEITLGKQVREVLLHGGGSPSDRANVAVGLIESRVREAYRMEAA